MLYLSGSLYVVGSFNSYRGTTVANIVKLNSTNGNLDTTFSQTTGTNSAPSGIVYDGTSIFVYGGMTSYRGTTTYGILKLDPSNGNLDLTFVGSGGVDNSVLAFIPKTATVYYTFGNFGSYRGKTTPFVVPISTLNGAIQ